MRIVSWLCWWYTALLSTIYKYCRCQRSMNSVFYDNSFISTSFVWSYLKAVLCVLAVCVRWTQAGICGAVWKLESCLIWGQPLCSSTISTELQHHQSHIVNDSNITRVLLAHSPFCCIISNADCLFSSRCGWMGGFVWIPVSALQPAPALLQQPGAHGTSAAWVTITI